MRSGRCAALRCGGLVAIQCAARSVRGGQCAEQVRGALCGLLAGAGGNPWVQGCLGWVGWFKGGRGGFIYILVMYK